MTIFIKRSTDVGAPVLNNTAGSYIALFDYLLVTTLGYTKTVLGTNIAKYRQPSGTNQLSLQVKDTLTTGVFMSGWETLTATDTGTGQFPTAAQLSTGVALDKSASMSWRFFSNGKIFYLMVRTSATIIQTFAFGDFTSFKSGDLYGTIIIGNTSSPLSSSAFLTLATGPSQSVAGHYVCRSHTQLGASLAVGKFSDLFRSNNSSIMGSGTFCAYPSPVDGTLKLAQVWINEPASNLIERGFLPGITCLLHNVAFADGDTFQVNVGPFAGRSFEVVAGGPTTGQYAIETSDTWGE